MEGVPRIAMIGFPLKRSADAPDIKSKIKRFVSHHYHEDPESYNQEIATLESLRAAATHVSRDITGCATLKKYFCQLNFLKSRFPFHEGSQIATSFSWYDAYSDSVHGWKDIDFEMACVLYNIGALHTELGAKDPRINTDGMKTACTHFQCAAWAFQHLKNDYHKYFSADLSSDILGIMTNICLAQAQECILEKSLIDNRKSAITAKVSLQIVEYYQQTLKSIELALKKTSGGPSEKVLKAVKKWKDLVETKVHYYSCLSYLYRGLHSEEQSKFGERITFFKAGVDKLAEAIKCLKNMDKSESSVIAETLNFTSDVIGTKLTSSEKENEFVYHEKVPELDSIDAEFKGVSLVKGIPFKFDDPEVSGPDIFSRLVPMEAHEASSLYSEEKAKILRTYSAKVEEKDNSLERFLLAMQLEQLDLHSDANVPQELVDCCASLSVNPEAVKKLSTLMSKLSGMFHDVEHNLKEINELLKEEEVAEKEFHKIVGKRSPSNVITELSREVHKYQQAHVVASESNQTLHEAMKIHVGNLQILMKPFQEVLKSLPSVANADKDEAAIAEMKRLRSKVQEMRTQREMLTNQLRESILQDDITKTLVVRQDQDMQGVFNEELKKHEKITQLLDRNLAAQDNILRAVTEANAAYAETRRSTEEVMKKRHQMIQDLLGSYDAYNELLIKCTQGVEFYTKLDTNVSKLLQRVRSACKVLEEEREGQTSSILKKENNVRATVPYNYTQEGSKDSYESVGGQQQGQQQYDATLQQQYEKNLALQKEFEALQRIDLQQRMGAGGADNAAYAGAYSGTSNSAYSGGTYSPTGGTYNSNNSTSYAPSTSSYPAPSTSSYAVNSTNSYAPNSTPSSYGPSGGTYSSSSPSGGTYSASSAGGTYPGNSTSYIPNTVYYNTSATPTPPSNSFASTMYPSASSTVTAGYPAGSTNTTQMYPMSSSSSYQAGSGAPQVPSYQQASVAPQVAYPPASAPSYPSPSAAPSYPPASAPSYPATSVTPAYPPASAPSYPAPSATPSYPPASAAPTYPPASNPESYPAYPAASSVPSQQPYPATPGNVYQNQASGQAMYQPGQYNSGGMTSQYGTGYNYTYPANSTGGQQQQQVANGEGSMGTGTGAMTSSYSSDTSYTPDTAGSAYNEYNPNPLLQQYRQQYGSELKLDTSRDFGSFAILGQPQGQVSYEPQGQGGQYASQYPPNSGLPGNYPQSSYTGQYPGTSQQEQPAQYTFAKIPDNQGAYPANYSVAPSDTWSYGNVPTSDTGSMGYPAGYYGQAYAGYYQQPGNQVPSQAPQVAQVPNEQIQNQVPTQQVPGQYGSVQQTYQQPSGPVQSAPAKTTAGVSNVDLLAGVDVSLPDPPLQPLASSSSTPVPEASNHTPVIHSNGIQTNGSPGFAPPGENNTSVGPVNLPVLKKSPAAPAAGEKSSSLDPLSQALVSEKFVKDVENLEHTFEGFYKKSLNGPTNLDIKWKEVMDKQNAASIKMDISVARCYPMKNRYPDILPYDQTRVPIPDTKDDYINASFVRDVSPWSIPFIATQAPLPVTFSDFWHMIWYHQIELIACLTSDAELKDHIYWPLERGKDLQFGPLIISLQTKNAKPNYVERIFSVTNRDTKQTRVTIHLQFKGWNGNVFPENPAPLLHFINEVHNFFVQQRSLSRPVVVHCMPGVGRTGIFILLSAAIREISTAPGFPDLSALAGVASEQRRGMMNDKEHLRFAYQCLLYYCQDLLMKRGILSARNEIVFEEKKMIKKPGHSRHPSQDFLTEAVRRLCTEGAPDGVPAAPADELGPPTPEKSARLAPPMFSDVPAGLLDVDASTFQQALTNQTVVVDPKRSYFEVRKGALINKAAAADEQVAGTDPLDALDPLWTLKK